VAPFVSVDVNDCRAKPTVGYRKRVDMEEFILLYV
jgi:hypothetical protein